MKRFTLTFGKVNNLTKTIVTMIGLPRQSLAWLKKHEYKQNTFNHQAWCINKIIKKCEVAVLVNTKYLLKLLILHMQQNMLRDTCLRHSSAAIVDKNDVIHEFHPIQRIKHKQGLMIPTKRHANGFFFFNIFFLDG